MSVCVCVPWVCSCRFSFWCSERASRGFALCTYSVTLYFWNYYYCHFYYSYNGDYSWWVSWLLWCLFLVFFLIARLSVDVSIRLLSLVVLLLLLLWWFSVDMHSLWWWLLLLYRTIDFCWPQSFPFTPLPHCPIYPFHPSFLRSNMNERVILSNGFGIFPLNLSSILSKSYSHEHHYYQYYYYYYDSHCFLRWRKKLHESCIITFFSVELFLFWVIEYHFDLWFFIIIIIIAV